MRAFCSQFCKLFLDVVPTPTTMPLSSDGLFHYLHLSVRCHHRAAGARCWSLPRADGNQTWCCHQGPPMENRHIFFTQAQVVCDIWSSRTVITQLALCLGYWQVSHIESVNLCLRWPARAWMPRNWTLLKQNTSGTEAGERVDSDYFGPNVPSPATGDHESSSPASGPVCSSE